MGSLQIALALGLAIAGGAVGWHAAVGWHDVGGLKASARSFATANLAWVEQAKRSDEATERLRLESIKAAKVSAQAVAAAEAKAKLIADDADVKINAMIAVAATQPKEQTCATTTEAIEAGRAFLEGRRQ